MKGELAGSYHIRTGKGAGAYMTSRLYTYIISQLFR